MKKYMLTWGLALFTMVSAVAGNGGAMDPHFSQFYGAPLLLNPAMTGAMSCNYRITGIFRSQWGSVLSSESVPMFRTTGASVDFRTNKGFMKGDAFGIGLVGLNDIAGQSRFVINRIGLPIAYHKSLDRRNEHFVTLGISFSMWQMGLSKDGLQFPNQHYAGTGLYDPTAPSGESINTSMLFWDIAFGVMYTGRFGRYGKGSGYIGFAVDHVNRPSISFLNSANVRMPIRYTFHGGYRLPLSRKFDFQPKFIYMNQGVSHEFNVGADIRVLFDEKDREGNNFRFGAMFRTVGGDPGAAWKDNALTAESVILTAGIEFAKVNFGFAYDVNVSQLVNGSQSQGAFELHASYVGCFAKRHPATIFCPKF
jgi:type IX secretion system PorP/SprF family membrane protein